MAEEDDPLCCCEYYNIREQRTHLLTFCCECDELDKSVDDWIKGNPQKLDRLTTIIESFTDRCRFPWFGGAKTFDFGSAFPPIFLPVLAYIACWHYILTIVVFMVLPVMVLFCYVLAIKLKMRTRLFLSLSITSTIGCYAVYFYCVAPFQTFQFNIILISSAIAISKCFHQSRQKPTNIDVNSFETNSTFCGECRRNIPFRGKHCRICKQCVLKYDHHCVWIDSCVGQYNLKVFLLTVLLYLVNIVMGCYITLSFVCKWDIGLLPDCSQAYDSDSSALVFICCCYALIIGVGLMVLLTQQIILISFNVTSYEWRHMPPQTLFWSSLKISPYNNGILANWVEFIKT
ncbi:palmitoyltransferase ZDHHC23-like [Dendronephthya gigantea]|uniref:palmitoyltransferase ZDHHC23-like n=1 Tax=Dendronephthya gigantea TaxID=151771 RepID=UPI00106A3243|nr:palmitoyltransferase ZDHHC23-like [Dendronephthya gigantea]